MKKMHKWIWLTAIWFVFMQITAKVWSPETLPMVHLQDARRYVCNPDGVLPQEVVDSTDAVLAALERDKGVETVVVVVKRIENGDAYAFAMELGRKYGVGDAKQNTGLIIVLATDDRKYQFLTGRGLEGTLPDAICRRIQNRVMVPALKQGDWATAIYQSVKTIDGYVRGDESITREKNDGDGDTWMVGLVLFLVICVVVYVIYSSSHRSYRKCPHCGKRKWNAVKKRRYREGNLFYILTTWRCQQCGHEEEEKNKDQDQDRDQNNNTGASSILPFIILAGLAGSRRGGGSYGGGSFGGGSFGGGSFGGGGSGGSF